MSEQGLTALKESIARIDQVFQRFREMIDTDNTISPSIRGALHMMIDDNLRCARARMFEYIIEQQAQQG